MKPINESVQHVLEEMGVDGLASKINAISQSNNLPKITQRAGNFYRTEDPKIIVKVSQNADQWALLDAPPNAVAKVHHIEDIQTGKGNPTTVTFQSVVDDNPWNRFDDPTRLVNALDELPYGVDDYLESIPQAANLLAAIQSDKLPSSDLTSGNIGMDDDGNLVAFDI